LVAAGNRAVILCAAISDKRAMATYTPRDKFYRKARAQGLASRAAFKIEELIGRFKLARPGAKIVDLGCAPGGWLEILARAVGENGLVVGVDLVACASRIVGVITIAGDIREPAVAAAITARLGGPADLITSDLAPKLSGIAARDQARSAELIEAAIGVAEHSLRPGGAMVAKLFMGGDFEQSVAEFRRRFRDVQIARTEATRPGSSELYVVARDFYRAGERET
jgi:23S rRNA (uridine2552-2'-O)-methyltransferase